MKELENALLVMVLTPHIRAYLERMDPMALKQALEALEAVEKEIDPEIADAEAGHP
jgi:hypothetical protein